MSKANSNCSVCGKTYYRRPQQSRFRAICMDCRKKENEATWVNETCIVCNTNFKYARSDRKRKTCSRECSNKNRAGINYTKKCRRGKQQKHLFDLKTKFDFHSCMVIGCGYNLTYDVHRLIPGRDGGKYEIGNMFAICPNHHAECHRGICILEKVNDYTLKAIYGAVTSAANVPALKAEV